jgi:hypothetical protein
VVRTVPRLWALAALAVALVVAAPASAAGKAPTRYSLAGGCYALQSAASGQTVAGADSLRMQATDLGSYLLYRPDGTFLAAQSNSSVSPDSQPSPAADWVVTDAGSGSFTLSPKSAPDRTLAAGQSGLTVADPAGAGQASHFSFAPASSCAAYPEAELNATGTPSKGKTSYGRVGGILEGHMHWMNFEYLGGDFHCGRPWSPYGIPYALPNCDSIEGPQGTAAPAQNFLNYGNPGQPHDTTGWPKLTEWNAHNLTYDGVYWRWVERAWMAGDRLMVMTANENRVLCELLPQHRNTCNEMDTARLEFQDIRDLQRYVDAQAGGPGKGFFQIVTNPYQARRVINQGKLAVVLEIELSEPFDCRGWETSTCDKGQIKNQLDEMYKLGVRSSLLLNKFDNPLTGVRFDSGPVGVLINAGNHQSAGSFWSAKTCTGPYHDNEIESGVPQGSSFLDSALSSLGVTSGTFPTYPPAPHCNTRGLTDLGRFTEEQMMAKHMIINPDHMSQLGVDDTLTLLEAHHYSGVISPHGWMDPGNWPRLWKLGGIAFPGHSTSSTYIKDYNTYRPLKTPYLLGWGYGADLGGLSVQPDAPDPSNEITYPFKSYDGKVTFQRQTTGERTFDYNKEGVAHYGLYADWLNDLQRHGPKQMSRDMWNGAEAYLEMWERANGIRTRACHPAHGRFTRKGRGPRLQLRKGWVKLLHRAGQPQQRTRAWSYCIRGRRNRHAADVAELTQKGRVELVGSTGRNRTAAGFRVGDPVGSLTGVAHPVGHRVFVESAGRSAFVFAANGTRIRAVGVATRRLAGRPAALRKAMRRVLHARATNIRPTFIPNPAAGAARLLGRPLAGSSNPRLNRELALLCSLSH